jgi:hypothetical protein
VITEYSITDDIFNGAFGAAVALGGASARTDNATPSRTARDPSGRTTFVINVNDRGGATSTASPHLPARRLDASPSRSLP